MSVAVCEPHGRAERTALPADRPRGSERAAATVSLEAAEPLVAAIRRFTEAQRVDLARVLATAFTLFVQRYTGESGVDEDRSFLATLASAGTPAADPAIPFEVRLDAVDAADEASEGRDDIAVTAFATGTSIVVRWTYDAQQFDRATVKRFGVQYLHLLEAALAEPDAPVAGLAMMSERERLQTIALGRGAPRAYERDETIHERFARQAERTPDAVAVRDAATVLTYGDVQARSNRLAHYLRSLGVGPRASVAVALERSADVPVVLLGILKAGAAYVPLDLDYPPERLRFMIEDANVGLVVSDARSRSRLPLFGTAVVALDDDRDLIAAQSARMPDVPAASESRAYVMYTSGSTGRAKGVAVPHRGIVRLVRNTDFVEIAADDVFFQYAPLAFDASTFELWAPLLNGAALAVPAPGLLAIDELGRELDRFGVTTLWLTAAMFRTAMEQPPAAFGRLRALLTGGDVVSAPHARRFVETFPNVRLINGYGPTENTTFSCCYTVPAPEAIGERLPIGRPIANASAYVVDARLEPVPVGVPGELCVGGDGVACGYLHLSELTAERFVPDPFAIRSDALLYRTGDRARWRADGVLEFLGRADHQVKIRGYRIELEEIESQLLALPGVAHAAVVVAETASDKSAVAFAVAAPGTAIDERGLRARLRETLPAYMVPQRIAVVASLPMHASGKIDRVALAREAASIASPTPVATPGEAAPPRRPRALQLAIAEIWRDVLKVDAAPDPDTNFFDAGGDSLLLLTLQTRVAERLDVRVGVMDLFEHTTIRSLVTFIGATAAR